MLAALWRKLTGPGGSTDDISDSETPTKLVTSKNCPPDGDVTSIAVVPGFVSTNAPWTSVKAEAPPPVTSANAYAVGTSSAHSIDLSPWVTLPATVPVTLSNTMMARASSTSPDSASATISHCASAPSVSAVYATAMRAGAVWRSVPANTTSVDGDRLLIFVGSGSARPVKSVDARMPRRVLSASAARGRIAGLAAKPVRSRNDDDAQTTGFVPVLRTSVCRPAPCTGTPPLTWP